jgi:hypothetical protein
MQDLRKEMMHMYEQISINILQLLMLKQLKTAKKNGNDDDVNDLIDIGVELIVDGNNLDNERLQEIGKYLAV